MKISFFVQGIPKPHGIGARAIVSKKFGRPIALVYDQSHGRDWKRTVRAEAEKHKPATLLAGPINLSLTFYMPVVKSFSKKRKAKIEAGEIILHEKKPDRTALLRAVEDALTGIIWRDDSQVADGPVRKQYGDPPGCLVEVETIE